MGQQDAGRATTSYVYGVAGGLPVLLDDGTRKYVWGAAGLAYSVDKTSGAVQVYHTDGLGSVRALTDSTGSVIQTYGTDEFGIPNATLTTGASSQSVQYTGEQRDAESSFMYLRARMYDPNIGRFMQADPLRKSGPGIGGWNRYSYVGNNPTSLTDPAGTYAKSTILKEGPLFFSGSNGDPKGCLDPSSQQQCPFPIITCLFFGTCTAGVAGAKNFDPNASPGNESSGFSAGAPELIRISANDPAAEALAARIGGRASVRFSSDLTGREFDAVSDLYVAQTKPAGLQLGSRFRKQAKATFEMAIETGRTPYFHFEGPPSADVLATLQDYADRYGIQPAIDTVPLFGP